MKDVYNGNQSKFNMKKVNNQEFINDDSNNYEKKSNYDEEQNSKSNDTSSFEECEYDPRINLVNKIESKNLQSMLKSINSDEQLNSIDLRYDEIVQKSLNPNNFQDEFKYENNQQKNNSNYIKNQSSYYLNDMSENINKLAFEKNLHLGNKESKNKNLYSNYYEVMNEDEDDSLNPIPSEVSRNNSNNKTVDMKKQKTNKLNAESTNKISSLGNNNNNFDKKSKNEVFSNKYSKNHSPIDKSINEDRDAELKPTQFHDSNIIVNINFTNNETYSFYYSTIYPICQIATNILSEKPKFNDDLKIEVNLPSHITPDDFNEFLHFCKNNFQQTKAQDYCKMLDICDSLQNEYIIKRVLLMEIMPKLSKHNSFVFLNFSEKKLTTLDSINELDDSKIIRNLSSSLQRSINKCWFELFFCSIDIVSRNLNFYFESSKFTKDLLIMNKKVVEELCDKQIMFYVKNGYYYQENAAFYMSSYLIKFDLKSGENKIRESNLIISSDVIELIILFLVYSRKDSKLIDISEVINNEQNISLLYEYNIVKMINKKQVLDLLGLENLKDKHIDNDNLNTIFKKFSVFLRNNLKIKTNLITSLIEEQLLLTGEESLNEIHDYSVPTFLVKIEKGFSNYYNEFTILLQQDKLVVTLIVFYKKSEDLLEISIKYVENIFCRSFENFIVIPLFTNFSFLSTLNIAYSEKNSSTGSMHNLINLISGESSRLFVIPNFKTYVNSCNNNSKEIELRINLKTCFIHTGIINVIEKNFFDTYYKSRDLVGLNKNVFGNIIKDLAQAINIDKRPILPNDISTIEANKRLFIAIINWLSEKSNINEEIFDIIEYITWEDLPFQLITDFMLKINLSLYKNEKLKSKYYEKIANKIEKDYIEKDNEEVSSLNQSRSKKSISLNSVKTLTMALYDSFINSTSKEFYDSNLLSSQLQSKKRFISNNNTDINDNLPDEKYNNAKESSLVSGVKECNYENNYEKISYKNLPNKTQIEKNSLNNQQLKLDYFKDQEDLLECNQIKDYNNLNELNINHNTSNIKLYSISDNNTNSVKNSFKIGANNINNSNFNKHFKDLTKVHDNNNPQNIDKTNTEVGNNSNIIGNLNIYINDNVTKNINTNFQPKNHKLSNENVLFDKYCEKNLITGASIGDSFYVRKSTSFNANNIKVEQVKISNINEDKEKTFNKNFVITSAYSESKDKNKLKKEPKEMSKLSDNNSKVIKTNVEKNTDVNGTLRPKTSINKALSRNSNAFLFSNASNKSKGKTSIRDKTLISEELRKMKDEINRTIEVPSKSNNASNIKSIKHSSKNNYVKNENLNKKYNFSGLYNTHLKQVLTENLNKNIKKLTAKTKTNDHPMILNYDAEGYPLDKFTLKIDDKESLNNKNPEFSKYSSNNIHTNTKNEVSKSVLAKDEFYKKSSYLNMINFMTKPQGSTSKAIKSSLIKNSLNRTEEIKTTNQNIRLEMENNSKLNETNTNDNNESKNNNLSKSKIEVKEKVEVEQDKPFKFNSNSKVKIFSDHHIKQKQQPFQQKTKGFLKSKLQTKSIVTTDMNNQNYDIHSSIKEDF